MEMEPLQSHELEQVDLAAAALGKKEGQERQADVRQEIGDLLDTTSREEFLEIINQLASQIPDEQRESIIQAAKRERSESPLTMKETESRIMQDRVREIAEEARDGNLESPENR